MLKRMLSCAALAAVLAAAGCSEAGLGPKPKPEGDPKAGTTLYEYDPTKPDGPVLQALRAAQERNEELFRSAFAPEIDVSRLHKETFGKLRQKVLKGKVTPVPDSTQMVSDTEAVVKIRGGKGNEIPITVKKYGDRWLIADARIGQKGRERMKKQNQQNQQNQQPKPAGT